MEQQKEQKEYKHITVYETAGRHRSRTFEISSNEDGTLLGNIYYLNTWRQYVFEPALGYPTIWSQDCLKDLCEFLIFLKDERAKRLKEIKDAEVNGAPTKGDENDISIE